MKGNPFTARPKGDSSMDSPDFIAPEEDIGSYFDKKIKSLGTH